MDAGVRAQDASDGRPSLRVGILHARPEHDLRRVARPSRRAQDPLRKLQHGRRAAGRKRPPSLEDVRGTPLCSRSLIVQTLYERAKEFFRIYRDVIEKAGHLDKVHAVIITGGGANLRAIDEVARDVFGVPVRIGAPLCFDEKNALSMRPNASVAAGLLMAADKTRAAGDSRSYRTPSLLNLSGRIRTCFSGTTEPACRSCSRRLRQAEKPKVRHN